MRRWLHIHQQAVAFACFAVFVAIGLHEVTSQADDRLWRNSIAACERGNVIRQVIHANTRAAAEKFPNSTYNRQLATLNAVSYADPLTGTVDCEQAIPKP